MDTNGLMPTPATTNLSTKWQNIWQKLTQPATSAQSVEENRRRATLNVLLMVFMPLALITAFSSTIASILQGDELVLPPIAAPLAFIVLVIAYVLSRTKYFEWAVYLTVVVPFIAVSGILFSINEPPSDIMLFYLSLGIILSSLLLDARKTLLSGVLTILIIIVAYLRPIEGQLLSPPIPMFIVLVTGIMSLMSYVRDNYVHSLEDASTELKEQIVIAEEARERAEKSDQVKSSFLASMSHELRTPLNAIINFTRFVIDGDTGPVNDQQRELLTEVVGSSKHLLNLINDVLDMSKIESNSLNLFVEDDVNLQALLNSSIKTAKSLLADKPVRLAVDIDDNIPLMRGDKQRILQILLNILSNACKFTAEGEIIVRAHQKGDNVLISVADTGPGIAPEDQEIVFEAFKQTTTGLRQGSGTGLGMPIAKNLTEVHGGRLLLDSELNKGTTFSIILPIKSPDLVPVLT